MHASEEEAREETLKMLNVYKDIQENYLALPVLTGKKTEKEKFAGAVETYTLEAMMYDGVALQNGTSHYFGQGFAKAFDIQFLNKDNKLETPYQTSWGVSTRMIGGLIMTHSDDNGLVLPPMVAPTKVAIIPIGDVNEVIYRVTEELKANEITFIVDDSDKSPGFKFAEAEVKGYPIRLEVGKRDLDKRESAWNKYYSNAQYDDSIKEEYGFSKEDAIAVVKKYLSILSYTFSFIFYKFIK